MRALYQQGMEDVRKILCGMSKLNGLPRNGVYTLIIFLNKRICLKVRRLGYINLQMGYYAYTGSALGNGASSLRARVARHLKKKKAKHWHIDFLLAHGGATVVAVVAAESNVKRECQINNAIQNIEGVMIPVDGFGASDCKQNCKSHLVYCGKESATQKIANVYARLIGINTTLSFSREA